MKTLVVTLTGSAQQVTTQNLYASTLIVQANTAAATLGTSGVTAATGITLGIGTPVVIPNYTPRGIPLNSLYVIGTASDTVVFLYEPSA